jgi:transposase
MTDTLSSLAEDATMNTAFRLHRDLAALKTRRMQAVGLFEAGRSQADVARTLGVSRQSVSRWSQAWRRQGAQGLEGAGRAGRKPGLSPEDLRRIEQALLRGPGVCGYASERWTLRRVAKVIEEVCGVRYHPGHVWRLLDQIGWNARRWAGRNRTRAGTAS